MVSEPCTHLDSEFVAVPETAYELDTYGQFCLWIADIVLWKWEGATEQHTSGDWSKTRIE